LKKKLSNSGLLYVILDKEIIDKADKNIFSLADKLCLYGADILQLRAKNTKDKELLSIAKRLSNIIHKHKKIFIVNDRADIAFLSGASGLHLGKGDLSPEEARKIVGKKIIIGRTVHSLNELKKFEKEDIDYIGVGPVFKTKVKPLLPALNPKALKSIASKSKKLMFAIGGINLYNISSLAEYGINNAAVCRGVILSKNLKNCVKNYKKCLQKAF